MPKKITKVCADCGNRVKNRSKKTKRCIACEYKKRNLLRKGRVINVFCKICKKELSCKLSRTLLCRNCWKESKIIPPNKNKKGQIPWNKGTRGICKAWNKGKGIKTSYNKRMRNSLEYKIWREAVYKRDNYTCNKCQTKGYRLHPHHIKNFTQYPKLRFLVSNGITLCVLHHIKFHREYGRKNNNKDQIKKYVLF